MEMLNKTVTENDVKEFVLDKPKLQHRVASKRPKKEIIKGLTKY